MKWKGIMDCLLLSYAIFFCSSFLEPNSGPHQKHDPAGLLEGPLGHRCNTYFVLTLNLAEFPHLVGPAKVCAHRALYTLMG